MKKYAIITGTIIFIIIIIAGMYLGLSRNIKANFVGKWPADGVYFVPWDSYQGYFTYETPNIQLSLIQVHKTKKSLPLSYKHFALISEDNKEIDANFSGYFSGSETNLYSMYTLVLNLPQLKTGSYIIKKIKLVDNNDKTSIHNIGSWYFEVKEGNEPNDFKFGNKTAASNIFDEYRVEVFNTSPKNIEIKNINFKLNKVSCTTLVNTSDSFKDIKKLNENTALPPNVNKTFIFTFKNTSIGINDKIFISLKPFLTYKINSEEKTTTLPIAIYSPDLNDTSVLQLVKSISIETP